jgi:hypothetical protein
VEHLHINLHTAATNAAITQQKEIVITESTPGHKVGLTRLAARKVIYFTFMLRMGMLTGNRSSWPFANNGTIFWTSTNGSTLGISTDPRI